MKIGVDLFLIQPKKQSIVSSNSSDRPKKTENCKYYLF
jgi:hypothetical protein